MFLEIGIYTLELKCYEFNTFVLDILDNGQPMWAGLAHIQQCAILFWELVAQVEQFDQHGQQVIEIEVECLHFLEPVKSLIIELTLVHHVQVRLRGDLDLDIPIGVQSGTRHDAYIEHVPYAVLLAFGVGLPYFEWALTMECHLVRPTLQHRVQVTH